VGGNFAGGNYTGGNFPRGNFPREEIFLGQILTILWGYFLGGKPFEGQFSASRMERYDDLYGVYQIAPWSFQHKETQLFMSCALMISSRLM